eukprot:510732_1
MSTELESTEATPEIESGTASVDSVAIDLNSEDAKSQLAEIESMKPSRSGYMLFGKEHRKQIGACGSVSEQSKRISALWNALNDDEKQEWTRKVNEEKEKWQQYLSDNPLKKRLLDQYLEHKKANKNKANISFQNGTIKKMILRDPDIKRISKEAVIVINNATKLFIQHLVNKINNEETNLRSSKTLSENDFINTIHSNSQYMFLRHEVDKNKSRSVSGRKRKATDSNCNTNEPPKKKAKHNNNGNTITQFFNQKS